MALFYPIQPNRFTTETRRHGEGEQSIHNKFGRILNLGSLTLLDHSQSFHNCSSPCLRVSVVKGLWIQHDLAEHLALFHILVSGARVFQWKRTIHHRFESSVENVLENLVQFAHRSHVGAKNG